MKLKTTCFLLRYYRFHLIIFSFGFEENLVDGLIYHKFNGSKFIFLILYLNEVLLANNDIGLLYKTKKFLSKDINVKDLGDVSFVLRNIDTLRSFLTYLLGYYKRAISIRIMFQEIRPFAKGDKCSLNQYL